MYIPDPIIFVTMTFLILSLFIENDKIKYQKKLINELKELIVEFNEIKEK